MTKLSIFQKTEQIPVAVERYMENTGAKQPDVAKISGVGLTYVNQILQRKTHIGKTAIKDVYYLGLAKAIGLDIRVSYWQHFDTANFQQIINKIKEVRESGERATIDGDTGSGKTHALRQYITRYPQQHLYRNLFGGGKCQRICREYWRSGRRRNLWNCRNHHQKSSQKTIDVRQPHFNHR